nr:ATP-dependent zinc protease [Pseudomonas sp. CFBP 13719]
MLRALHTAPKESQVKNLLALLSILALPALAAEPTLYGRYEYIKLPEIGGQTLKAKMDTGALTASLSAKDIQTFTRDGDDWVRFRLATKDADNKVYEHKVSRMSKIKNRAEEDDDGEGTEVSQRPVVDLELCLGDVKRTIEVNLVDRSSFNYPLLIGAKGLREFKAAVNPARRFVADKPDC